MLIMFTMLKSFLILTLGITASSLSGGHDKPFMSGFNFMKEIIINSPKYGVFNVIVDDEDYEYLIKKKWHIHKDKKRKDYYAWANGWENKKQFVIKMHRLILGVTDPKIQVDHKDRNTLNNTRENLRLATHAQNHINKPKAENKTSKYVGVCWDKSKGKWMATIAYNNKWHFLGRFENENEAAIVRNEAAKRLHGEFAVINEII